MQVKREIFAALKTGRWMLQRRGLAGVQMVASATRLRHLLTLGLKLHWNVYAGTSIVRSSHLAVAALMRACVVGHAPCG